MNYTAPEVEIINVETQNCFASNPSTMSISSEMGLNKLDEVDADWN